MRHILLSVLVTSLFVGQASAGMFTLDTSTALKFTHSSVSSGDLGGVLVGPTTSTSAYGGPMQGEVGWIGWLMDMSHDKYATMTISAGGAVGLSGTFDGYRAYIASDDDDPWNVRLFVKTSGGGVVYSDWTPMSPLSQTTLMLNQAFTIGNSGDDIGFQVQGHFLPGQSPSNPDAFKISAVPIPAAVLLGFLGLTAAGLKLRKFV